MVEVVSETRKYDSGLATTPLKVIELTSGVTGQNKVPLLPDKSCGIDRRDSTRDNELLRAPRIVYISPSYI